MQRRHRQPLARSLAAPSEATLARDLRAILAATYAFPTLRKLRTGPWTVEARLVGAPAMRRLNARYRDKDYATDVLSFEAPEIFRRGGVLGELVICRPVLLRQAREQGHSARRELQVLLAHGILHLLGLDHERGPAEERRMRRWEDRVIGELGGRRGLVGRSLP